MCTGLRFTGDQGNLYFGRNLDVGQDYGEGVIITPRNYPLPYKFLDNTTTKKAVIGMGLVVDGYPSYFDCYNEDGLGIAGLNFPHFAKFSDGPIDGKINLASYEIMLWVTQNFTHVSEVKEALKNVNLVNEAINTSFAVASLHWIISDSDEAIVVEVSKQYGMKVFDDKVGVLTNSPDFNWQLTNLGNHTGLSPRDATAQSWNGQKVAPWGVGTGSLGLPGDSIPADRFVKAAYLNVNYPTAKGEKANVAKFFNILKSVAMIKGSVVNDQGKDEYTVYTACYSSGSKTYYCNFEDDFELKTYQLDDKTMNSTGLITY